MVKPALAEVGENTSIQLPGSTSPTDPSRALTRTTILPKREIRKNQIERLIDAMVLVASETGIENASVRSVCQRAGVAFSTFYQYFDSKDSLFLAALEAGVSRLLDGVAQVYYSADPVWSERVGGGIEAFLTVLSINPAFTQFFAIEANRAPAPLKEQAEKILSKGYMQFFRPRASAKTDVYSDQLGRFITGGMFAAISEAVHAGRIEELPGLAPTLTSFVVTLVSEQDPPRGGSARPSSPKSRSNQRRRHSPAKSSRTHQGVGATIGGTSVQLPGSTSPTDPSRALVAGVSRPREYVDGIQRGRLIDAMVLVASEAGFENASVRSVCQRAGVAYGTFYQHFESKEDLFLSAFDAGAVVLFEEMSAAFLTGDIPWPQRVEGTLRYFLEILTANPNFARFFAIESRRVSGEPKSHVDDVLRRGYVMFAAAEPVSQLTDATYQLAQIAIGGIYAVIYDMIQRGEISELPTRTATILTSYVMTLFTTASGAR